MLTTDEKARFLARLQQNPSKHLALSEMGISCTAFRATLKADHEFREAVRTTEEQAYARVMPPALFEKYKTQRARRKAERARERAEFERSVADPAAYKQKLERQTQRELAVWKSFIDLTTRLQRGAK
jgi:hypothetical protein